MPMHQKMMAYDRVLSHLNNARLAQTAFPLIFQFKTVASETPQGTSALGQVRHQLYTSTLVPDSIIAICRNVGSIARDHG